MDKRKWYQNKALLIVLLFILPPVGIVGIFQRKTKVWKKLIYTLLALFMSFWLLGLVLMFMFPVNHYEVGNKLFEKKSYKEAINEFRKVEKRDENYVKAQNRISLSESLLDSIENINRKAIEKVKQDSIYNVKMENNRISELKLFQKQWADSILKNESKKGNRHFVSVKYSLPDSILFEYTEGITKNGFENNYKVDTMIYRKHYRKSLFEKMGLEFMDYPCFITFIPNQKIVKSIDSDLWKHPVMLNQGLKIYKGNKYNKTYLGVLKCKFKDKDRNVLDGNQFVIIEKDNGALIQLLLYELKNYYWVKKSDPNYSSGVGLSKCY